ncbi:MAG TPA: hypothetical protein VD866_12000 [Urbifossiella sp.]|nr:hypothetical protein [Urbifossiella sp.]
MTGVKILCGPLAGYGLLAFLVVEVFCPPWLLYYEIQVEPDNQVTWYKGLSSPPEGAARGYVVVAKLGHHGVGRFSKWHSHPEAPGTSGFYHHVHHKGDKQFVRTNSTQVIQVGVDWERVTIEALIAVAVFGWLRWVAPVPPSPAATS